jgi:predicted dehydrogenase
MPVPVTRWAIWGLGKIAHKFARDLALIPGAELHAVASRSASRAQEFASTYQVPHAFGSYEASLQLDSVDAVYIAMEHTGHAQAAIQCLRNGWPVLCEKPLGINAREVESMIQTAREENVLLMEALWTRFLPITQQLLSLLQEGAIGEIQSIHADFGFKAPFDPDRRLFNPALGGGALLDIGIYPVFLALLLLGKPDEIKAMAKVGSTGVDEAIGMTFGYSKGTIAHLQASFRVTTPCEARIFGTEGTLLLHSRWHEGQQITWSGYGQKKPRTYHTPIDGIGYRYETEHFMSLLREDALESPWMPLDFSSKLMHTLDKIREQCGLSYPAETA